jgi:hypothetical protein
LTGLWHAKGLKRAHLPAAGRDNTAGETASDAQFHRFGWSLPDKTPIAAGKSVSPLGPFPNIEDAHMTGSLLETPDRSLDTTSGPEWWVMAGIPLIEAAKDEEDLEGDADDDEDDDDEEDDLDDDLDEEFDDEEFDDEEFDDDDFDDEDFDDEDFDDDDDEDDDEEEDLDEGEGD